jgi:lipoprotein signal peptidase
MEITSVKVNPEFHNLTRGNNNQVFGLFGDDRKILLLLVSIFLILFVLFKLKKLQSRMYFSFTMILLLLIIGILYNIR